MSDTQKRQRHRVISPASAWAGILALAFLLVFFAVPARALEKFRIAIMQPEEGVAEHYQALEAYLKLKGIYIDFLPAVDYPAAASMFANGEVDGMFSGSGVAGVMIIKDLAYPLVRPVDLNGRSTYWAVVVAPKGSAPFTGSAEYFAEKKVAYCSLASAGEFFLRALPGFDPRRVELVQAGSHGQALQFLASGEAEVAVVKNLVWERESADFKEFEQVGSDSGHNPNGALIIAKDADPALIEKVKRSLLLLGRDISSEAERARQELGIKGFVLTTTIDFTHTLSLLRNAGVTGDFNFRF